MSNIISHDHDLLARQLAASEERDRIHRFIAPIVDCIRQMRLEGLVDNQISDVFRHVVSSTVQGGGKRRSVTAACHIDVPIAALLWTNDGLRDTVGS
jgi:hypothetical protein